MRFFDGTIQLATTDLSSQGFIFPWSQTRSWSNGPGYATGTSNGNGWVDSDLPTLRDINGDGSTLAVVTNGTTAYFFDQVNGGYQERFFGQDLLNFDSTNGVFVLTDTNGNQISFDSFSTNLPANQRGQLESFADINGNVARVTSHTSDGRIQEVQGSSTIDGNTTIESYLYSYLTSGVNAGNLQNVTLRRNVNGGSWSTAQQVQYSYYDGTQSYGNAGDLMTALIMDGNNNVQNEDYYRYWTSSDTDFSTSGYQDSLKFTFSGSSYRRLVSEVINPLTATDAQVAPYADNYLEYGGIQPWLTKNKVQGQACAACGGAMGTYSYSYTQSQNVLSFTSWSVKTVETLSNGNQKIVYTNGYGEILLSIQVDLSSNQQWATFFAYDSRAGWLCKPVRPR